MAARLWLLLFFFYASYHAALSALVWRTVDLRFETIVQYAAIPLLQAVGLAWVMGGFNPKDGKRAALHPLSRLATVILWAAESVLLFLYLGPILDVDLSAIVARSAGIEALIAIVIILIRVLPSRPLGTWMAMVPFVMVVSALGVNAIHPCFPALLSCLPDGWSLLLKQIVLLVVTVILLVVSAGKAQGVFSERSPLAGTMMGWVQFFFVAAAMALMINGYLFGFLVSPWQEIIVTSLSLAATSLLTAALFLLPERRTGEPKTPSIEGHGLKRYPGFLRTWAVMTACAVAGTVALGIWFGSYRGWDLHTFLPLVLIPLVQTSWLRWVRAIRTRWSLASKYVKRRPVLSAFLLSEVIFFGWIAVVRDLWGRPAFSVGVAIWIGLKLVILGTMILKGTMANRLVGIFRWVYGVGAVGCGIATACAGTFPNAPWMMAASGSVLVLLAFWRSAYPANGVRLAGASAEGCLMPIVVTGICILLTRADPMNPLPWGAYSLIAFSTTFLVMALHTAVQNKSIC